MLHFRNENITYFAQTNYRNIRRLFGIKQNDRKYHSYILGKTGAGKTNLLLTQILQDIKYKRGVCVFDIHGDLIHTIQAHHLLQNRNDVVYLDIPNPSLVLSYNPLKRVSPEKRSLVAGAILESFEKLWGGAWGLKLEHILRYTLLTLLDQPKSNLGDILRIIQDEDFRIKCMKNIINPDILKFWQNEFQSYSKNDLLPLFNKVGAFMAHPAIKRLLITNQQDISLRKIMDNKGVLLVNLSKGRLGEDITHILGSLLLTSLSSAAFSRIDLQETQREPFHVFLDEFQNYTTKSLSGMLSELRKFGLSLTFAHQYLNQLNIDIQHGVLGNVGTIICFRLGATDAAYIQKELYQQGRSKFTIGDYVNLPNHYIYLKLMIDGKPSRPFSAITISYKDIY